MVAKLTYCHDLRISKRLTPMNLHPARKQIKSFLQGLPVGRIPPIVCASMGRSGSTMLHDAISAAVAECRFGPFTRLGTRIVSDMAWDLGSTKLKPGVVYKTHALAEEWPLASAGKAVFVFGRASAAVLSVLECRRRYGPEWIAAHLLHLRANGPFEQLVERDILRFREQIDGWVSLANVPRLIVRYDALWENMATLSDFLGVRVELPPRRPRSEITVADDQIIRKVQQTYGALDAYIDKLPTCQVLH